MAATSSRVNTRQIKLICWILSEVLAGFAGIRLFSQYKTARIVTGAGEELKAIASAVVGALLGGLIINTLRTGVVLRHLQQG